MINLTGRCDAACRLVVWRYRGDDTGDSAATPRRGASESESGVTLIFGGSKVMINTAFFLGASIIKALLFLSPMIRQFKHEFFA